MEGKENSATHNTVTRRNRPKAGLQGPTEELAQIGVLPRIIHGRLAYVTSGVPRERPDDRRPQRTRQGHIVDDSPTLRRQS